MPGLAERKFEGGGCSRDGGIGARRVLCPPAESPEAETAHHNGRIWLLVTTGCAPVQSLTVDRVSSALSHPGRVLLGLQGIRHFNGRPGGSDCNVSASDQSINVRMRLSAGELSTI